MTEDLDLLTIPEVAKELRVGEVAVRAWINEGKLEAVRLGSHPKSRIRIPRAAVDAFVQPAGREMTGTIRSTRVDETGQKMTLR